MRFLHGIFFHLSKAQGKLNVNLVSARRLHDLRQQFIPIYFHLSKAQGKQNVNFVSFGSEVA